MKYDANKGTFVNISAIIGSAAGVVAMGLENINFVWYFKKISLMAFVGYLAGIGVCMLEVFLFGI